LLADTLFFVALMLLYENRHHFTGYKYKRLTFLSVTTFWRLEVVVYSGVKLIYVSNRKVFLWDFIRCRSVGLNLCLENFVQEVKRNDTV
jgi:hypothetical protein